MVLTGLLVGAALGFAMQRGRFCVTGAFREVWIGGKTRWLTAFLIVIAIQSIGIYTLQALGVIDLSPGPMPLVATVVGGFLFGYAIVLAGGCATGTYYRSAEGLVGSWIALVAYAGFAAFMKYGPLAGTTAWLRSTTVTENATLYETLGISPWWLVAALTLGVGALTVHHLRADAARPKLATLPPRRTGLVTCCSRSRGTPSPPPWSSASSPSPPGRCPRRRAATRAWASPPPAQTGRAGWSPATSPSWTGASSWCSAS